MCRHMLTLALLRHAKSSWDDPSQDDFSRPLNARGRDAAPRIGRWMAERGLAPATILCSSAVRTRATLALVLPQLDDPAPRIRYDDDLYLASAPELLARIKRYGGSGTTTLVVGHNPGLHILARSLAGRGRREDLGALQIKLPTAGLVVLHFNVAHWDDIDRGRGELIDFVSPRRLPSSRTP